MFFHNYRHDTRHMQIYDVSPKATIFTTDGTSTPGRLGSLRIQQTSLQIHRLTDRRLPAIRALLESPRTDEGSLSSHNDWKLENVTGPDVGDRKSLISLAKMSSDAYVADHSKPDWLNYSMPLNVSQSFGWEENGLRGHVFANADNSTVIIAIKGTSAGKYNQYHVDDHSVPTLMHS